MSNLKAYSTLQRAAIASALLTLVAAPIALLHRDDLGSRHTNSKSLLPSNNERDTAIPVEQLLSLRYARASDDTLLFPDKTTCKRTRGHRTSEMPIQGSLVMLVCLHLLMLHHSESKLLSRPDEQGI